MNQTEDPLKRLYEAPNFKPFMKKLALISGVASIIGLLLKISGTPGARSLLIMGMTSLSMISFMAGHLFPCPENAHNMKGIWNFVMTYTGYAVSFGILGILFLLLHWPGANLLLIIAGVAIVMCLIGWVYILFQVKKNINN
ncbi:MAG: hypothetical protein J5701_07655 [Bacteroidales bacterium]|nr:hypothetical protein [Bacteroidales bacterium]